MLPILVAIALTSPSAPTAQRSKKKAPEAIDSRVFGTWWVDENSLRLSGLSASDQAKMRTEIEANVRFAQLQLLPDRTCISTDGKGHKTVDHWAGTGRHFRLTARGFDKQSANLDLSPDGWTLQLSITYGKQAFAVDLVKM